MLKALVGAASVAVIAAVGYYFLQEYNAYAARTAAADFQRKCRWVLTAATARPWTDEETMMVGRCVAAGQIAASEVEGAVVAMPAGKFTFQHLGDPSTKPELK